LSFSALFSSSVINKIHPSIKEVFLSELLAPWWLQQAKASLALSALFSCIYLPKYAS
jgi:hypothetical protein